MRLQGKVALITGAANGLKGELMGIGGATAWLFAREGARVVLGDVNDELGQRTASQIGDSGGQAQFVHLDVASARDWSDAVETAVDRFGRLDVLVNCAGNREPGSFTLEETTEELWDEVMDVHARGTFLGMKHAVPKMRDSGGGSIINISSVLGMVGQGDRTSYVAAKGAIRLMSKAVALGYAKENIRVNSVHPGTVLTPRNLARHSEPEWFARETSRIPLGRLAKAEELANAILYLASDESSYVTGSELVVDGGLTAQ
jgi:3alpha(or 20beta)-hydroxysteroid dehydrogenase